MKVVVTGAGGLLGSAVCSVLCREGHQLVCIQRRMLEREYELPNIPLDLCDSEAADVIVSLRPDVIIHFAAALPQNHFGPEAERVAEINRRIDATAFQVLKRNRARMIYASSLSVYGTTSEVGVDEQSPTNPSGPYAMAKLESEAAGQRLSREEGVGFIALRIGSPYGPAQRSRSVLKSFVEKALQGLPLQYYGTGSREQDFVHCLDVAEAVRCALEGGRDGVYNVATGNPITMKRLAELTVASIPGCRSLVSASGKADHQEGTRANYCSEKIQSELDWTSQIALSDGISACAREWSRRDLL